MAVSPECTFDGAGSFLGFTVEELLDCDSTASNLVAPQALIVDDLDLPATAKAHLFLTQLDAEEWLMSVGQFESQRTVDGQGGWQNIRFGHQINHSELPFRFEWPWEQDFDLSLLIGTKGTLRSTGSDGSYWSGKAKIVQLPGQPSRVVDEQSIGSIVFRWLGGTNPPTYTAPT
jgi:hypothetical protein